MDRRIPAALAQIVAVLRDLSERVEVLEDFEEEVSIMGTQIDRLSQDVADLGTAEAGAESRVAAEVAALQTQIDALKAQPAGADISSQLAALEATAGRLQALAQPAAPPVTQTPPAPADAGTGAAAPTS